MTLVTNIEDHDEEIVDSVLPDPNDGTEAMDVTEAGEEVSTCENKPSEGGLTGSFSWKINNFSSLKGKIYSDTFTAGGYLWRILVFPRGNNTDFLSAYLDVADAMNLPTGWTRTAYFALSIVSQTDDKQSVKMESTHTFQANESDWGFTRFIPLKDFYEPEKGYIVDDSVIINAYVVVKLDYWNYDSKKETGFVGLKNQGATCYLNSLLQTLYHIPYFRKAVYHMPTTEDDVPSKSIPLALQSLFYKLQFSESSVATKELTKSFGWDTYDSFLQHDVQELNRVLCEKLEDKMKGTVVEGTIQKLFEGHHNNFIECINVDFKSSRKESYYDLQLDVKGCKNIYDSFDKYVEIEKLEGDNKYHAEQHGLQDAKKGVTFIDFPPVLQLQLKRFEYDFVRDTMVKINDRYEFPLELDLDRENGKYLSPDADRSIRNVYALHSVLVHSGGIHGGHYYAFIRPTLSGQWYKFDDERVTKEDVRRALNEQYGGEEELPQNNLNNPPFKFTKYSNAYMLVYIRKTDIPRILCKVQEEDIAFHLRMRLKKEQEEKERRKKEKAEAHLYTIIKVATDDDLKQQIGDHLHFDLVDFEKVKSFRVQKQTPFLQFKEEVFKEFGIPVHLQRYWLWAKRQNHTFRPNRPLNVSEENQMVGNLKDVSNKGFNEVKLFLETKSPFIKEIGDTLYDIGKDDILIFFKLYDPIKEELSYVGRMFVRHLKCPLDYKSKILEIAGFSSNDDILLFEEIKFEPNIMCEKIEFKNSFKQSQLENGDIVCIQRNPQFLSNGRAKDEKSTMRYPLVGKYFEYIKNKQVVRLRRFDRPKEDAFTLELSKLSSYDEVVERIAHEIGLTDTKKIRLTAHSCFSQQPKPPIKYRGFSCLNDALVNYNQMTDILYYEVLDIPLPELQNLKSLKINFHNLRSECVSNHTILLPKQSTVADVIKELKTKVELSSPDAELRIMEVFYNKIFKVFPLTDVIDSINDSYWTLRAEEIPEEEKNISSEDKIIHVYHIYKESTQNPTLHVFGDPFFFVLHENETVGQVRERIRIKLNMQEDDIAKWKFAYVTMGGRPEYLDDSAVLMPFFPKSANYGQWEHYLGLEHADGFPKRSHIQNQSRHAYEKPVKIYN